MSIKEGLQAALGVFCFTLSPVALATVKIGIAGPHSGAYASFGEQLWQGATLAATHINANGGILGEPIELVMGDDACEPKQAITVANRLIDEQEVGAVIGHFCSSSTIPASMVYADAQVVMMTPASTSPTVTDRGLETIFRMCGRDDQQGVIAARYIHNTLKAERIAVVHDKDTYGKGLADAMVAELQNLGLFPVLYEGLTRGEKDYNALVTKIRQLDADLVYFGGLHPEAGPLLRQLRQQDSRVPFVSGDGIVAADFVLSAGGEHMLSNVYMTFGSDPRENPGSEAIIDEFREEGYEPQGYTLYSYASLQALAQAADATGAFEGLALSDWLKSNTVQTVMGQKRWDGNGDLAETDYVMYRWDQQGNYTPVG